MKNCKNQRSCQKRHPRVCKMMTENKSCQFIFDCAYPYPLEIEHLFFNNNEIIELKEKVDTLQLIIQVMAEKIGNLEAEMNIVKRVETHEEVFEEIESHKENSFKKDSKMDEVNKKGKKNRDKATNEDIVKSMKHNLNKKGNKCDDCEYDCKKKSTLQKHIQTKHKKEKSCDISEDAFNCDESIIRHRDIEEKTKKERSFVFSESMLGEFEPK